MTQQAEPISILADLRRMAAEVEKAAAQLFNDNLEFTGHLDKATGEWIEGVKPRYEQALDDALLEIHERAIANNQRPPAQDIREAMARRAVRANHAELHAQYLVLDTRIEATQKWVSTTKAAMSGLQSVLRGERN